MEFKRMLSAVVTAILLVQLASSGAARAEYPDGKVVLVDPYAAGGGIDLLTRIIGQRLAKKWNQTVLVENRVGASGIIGADYVAKSAPDGRTLLVIPLDAVINPLAFSRKADDPLKNLVPVASLAITNYVIAANPSKGYNSIADLISRARANQGNLTYGTCGSGSPARLVIQMLEEAAQVKFRYVPYRGGCAPAVNDALGSHIDFVIAGSGTVVQPIRSGLLKALAISSGSRDPALPDTPTLKESDFPNVAIDGWISLFAPEGTPAAIVEKIYADVESTYDAEVIKKIEELHLKPALASPKNFGRDYDIDIKRLGPLMEKLSTD